MGTEPPFQAAPQGSQGPATGARHEGEASMSKPAWESHPDAQEENNPGVQSRLAGMAEIGGTVTLKQMKAAVEADAANGRDPFAQGTVEAGLFLELDQYEQLREYAKSLTVEYAKRRRSS
jgi:hypothetical protein